MQTEEIIRGNTALDYTKESVKLVRNSKGFTWEIKIQGTGLNGLFNDDDMKRLKAKNIELNKEYGESNDA